jgi:hypothetical protein
MKSSTITKGNVMAKRILFFAILCIFAFSACDGSSSSSNYVDDCDENSADCQDNNGTGEDPAAE